MNGLSDRERELVAIGASIGSNCVPCIAFHVGKARQVGLTDEQIRAAVAQAEEVRAVPANLVVNTALAHLDSARNDETGAEKGKSDCGC